MQVGQGLSPLHDLGRGRLGSGEGDMLRLLHDLLLSGVASVVGRCTNSVPHLQVKIVKHVSGSLKQATAQFRKCNCSDRSLFPPGSRSFPARFPPPDQGLPVVVARASATLVLY